MSVHPEVNDPEVRQVFASLLNSARRARNEFHNREDGLAWYWASRAALREGFTYSARLKHARSKQPFYVVKALQEFLEVERAFYGENAKAQAILFYNEIKASGLYLAAYLHRWVWKSFIGPDLVAGDSTASLDKFETQKWLELCYDRAYESAMETDRQEDWED